MVGALVDDELFAILGVEETPDFAQPVDEMLALLQM